MRRVAVEQPLHELRRMLFGEVLRAEPAHRRDERARDCASGRARSDRRSARRRATSRARPAPSRATRRRPPAAAAAGRRRRPTPRRPSGPASALQHARREIEAGQNQHALERDPLPDVAVHVVRDLVREHDFDFLVRVLGQHRVRHEDPPRAAECRPAPRSPSSSCRRGPTRRRRARARRRARRARAAARAARRDRAA